MTSLFRKRSTVEKVREVREQARRGRAKGSTLSEEHKRRIGEGVMRARKQQSVMTMEQVLEAVEKEVEDNIRRYDIRGRKLGLYAFTLGGGWILSYSEWELEDAMRRVEQMMGWEKTNYVIIKSIENPAIKEGRRELSSVMKVEEGYMLRSEFEKEEE